MALGAAYEEEVIQALINSPVRPKPAPEQKFSAWQLATAVPRALTEAAAQRLGGVAEVMGGFGQVLGAYPEAMGPGVQLSGVQRQQADAQRQRLLAEGVDMSNDVGDAMRAAGRQYRPDPVTAHAAEQIVYGIARGAAKVVGDVLTVGPFAPAVTGLDEGLSAADDLRLQGVDVATRTKAGAAQGAGMALYGLPIVGQTKLATAGLYAIGGPGGFMAQQALTREILQGAGYDKIGAQFDPFDPVGLAVASLLPAGFAAYGLRQQKLQRAVDSLPDLPPRADVAPPAADTAPPTPFPSRPSAIADAVRAYPTEAVDAARVVLLAERRAAANPGAADNLQAMDQHEAALTRAEDQLAAGERVQVADVAPAIEPTGAVADAPMANGTYGDGGAWSAVFRAVDRTDGTVALVRDLTDDTGTTTQHLQQDGTWANGEPPRTALTLGAGMRQVDGPEAFPNAAAAMSHAVDVEGARRSGAPLFQTWSEQITNAARDLQTTPSDAPAQRAAAGEPVQVADVAPPTEAPTPPRSFAERLDAAIAERGYRVAGGGRSHMSGGPGERMITIADMPEADFMAKHGNPMEDVKAHEFAHAWWAGATGLPNFRDPRNRPLLVELRAVSREFRPTVWESHAAHANKPAELLADGMAFWIKHPERRADFPELDRTMRGYDAGGLVRQFPDAKPFPAWADQITAAIREMQAQALPPERPVPAPYTDGLAPPVAGMVRLYRADSPTVKFSDVFDAEALGAFKRPEGMTGRRFTDELKLAQYYRSSYGSDATISYVDVPAAALEGRGGAAGEYFIDTSPTDAPTTTQAANPEAAAPARGAGEPPAAAGAADAGRAAAAVEAAGLSGPTGATAEAITERGLSVPVRYRLAEAGSLTTSHTNDLTPNPAFPPELQPRDRTRAASAEQISRIENAIRPELLADSPKASDGAPIVGPDAVVESGNARTIALRRAYESGKADAYRAWLADNAERFGLTRQQVEGMQQPVLVRERLGNVDRAEFARQANESAVAAMSPTEQAMSDARRITDLSGLVANEDGTINMAQSADFVRQFIGQAVAPTERGTMLQANGQLSQAGMTRLRNAVFAKAYGDADILAMLTESTDANVRNILAGMLRAAPDVAKLADLAQAGARQNADIAGPLVEAVRLFSQLRSEGRTVQQFLSQGSMFGDGLSPEIAAMLEAVSLNARAPKRIAEMIGGMVDTVNALGDSRQMGMFGDAPTGADAVAGAAERAVMDSRMAMAQEKFPSMEVMLDGMEKPMPAAEFMAAMKAEADDLAADAPLMQVAAECALLNGV